MILTILTIIVAVFFVLYAMGSILSIGEERQPLAKEEALSRLLGCATVVTVLVLQVIR